MSTPQEAANVMYSHLMRPGANQSRDYIARFKQAMIDQRKVPVNMTRLNLILHNQRGPASPA